MLDRFSAFIGSDTPEHRRGLTIVGTPIGHAEYVSRRVAAFVQENTMEKLRRLHILQNDRQGRSLLLKYCCLSTYVHLARTVAPCLFASHPTSPNPQRDGAANGSRACRTLPAPKLLSHPACPAWPCTS